MDCSLSSILEEGEGTGWYWWQSSKLKINLIKLHLEFSQNMSLNYSFFEGKLLSNLSNYKAD